MKTGSYRVKADDGIYEVEQTEKGPGMIERIITYGEHKGPQSNILDFDRKPTDEEKADLMKTYFGKYGELLNEAARKRNEQ